MARVLAGLLLLLLPVPAAAQVTVDAPPELSATAQQIGGADLTRLRQALAQAGLDIPPRIHITLIPDSDPRARLIPEWVVGLASGRDRITIFPERVGAYPYDSLESVVHHEIAHLALNERADGRPLPRWFHEGTAVAIETGWGPGSQFRLFLASLRGPAMQDLRRLFASEAQFDNTEAYLLATALMADLRQQHGADLPGAVARRVATGVPFDRAFQIETGELPSTAAFRAWTRYSRWTTWIPAATSGTALWMVIMVLTFVVYAVQLRRRIRRRRAWNEDEDVAEWQ